RLVGLRHGASVAARTRLAARPGSTRAVGIVEQRVVAAIAHLEHAQAVAEGIGEVGDAPKWLVTRRLLERRAVGDGARDHVVDVLDDEVEVHRGPVTPVVARRGARRRLRARALRQEIDGTRRAEEL